MLWLAARVAHLSCADETPARVMRRRSGAPRRTGEAGRHSSGGIGLISRLRRWLGLSRDRNTRPPGTRGDTPAGGRVPKAAESSVAPPDERTLGTLYARHLFVESAGGGVTRDEQAWLRERRDALRDDGEAVAALVPRMPAVMPRLMAAVRDPVRTDTRELAALIESDPVLAANVIRVVNSPALRMRREDVDSLEQAVVIMGFSGMREVIAAATICPIASFDHDARLDGAALKQVWPQTLDVALELRSAASRAGSGRGFELYLAGLVHSSGLLALLRCLRSLQQPVPSEAFIAELEPLARRYSTAIARGWGFSGVTDRFLDAWAQEEDAQGEADMLSRAVAFMRARALEDAGVLDAGCAGSIRARSGTSGSAPPNAPLS